MKKIAFSLITVTTLLSLAACGSANNASTSKTSTSSAKTSVSSSSSSSKSSSSSQKKTTSSSQETPSDASSAVASSSSATQPASDSASATDAGQAAASPAPATAEQKKTSAQAVTKDVSNIASFVGTWANDRGESVTINADGSVITTASDGRTYNMGLSFTQELNGVGFYGIYVPGALVGGAGLLYIPAGVTNPHIGTTDAQDTLVIGQDVSADEHPYYRQ